MPEAERSPGLTVLADDWVAICPAEELWEGELLPAVLPGGAPIIVLNLGDRVVAYQGICPHQDTPLSDADFDGESIVCSAHLWEFDASTGQGVNPASHCLKRYEAEIRDGIVMVKTEGGRA